MAWTLDTLVEGVHFNERLSPEDVGFKAVAVSVSDLAAMGARPRYLLVGLSVLPHGDSAFVDGFARGLAEATQRWKLTLIGGDTTRCSGARIATTTLGGPCVSKPMVRGGARVGDRIWVTGKLGFAGVGWSSPTPSAGALAALRRPDPPVEFALSLAEHGLATAATDLSDGLAVDLLHLCRASSVGAAVHPQAIPGVDSLAHRVRGGDDFQLLFTTAPVHSTQVMALAHDHGISLTDIGAITAETSVQLVGEDWPGPLFDHFGEAS